MNIDPTILTGAAVAMGGALGTFACGAFRPRSRLFGPVVWRGPMNGLSQIALTFDDGPHPICTPQILDVLKQHNVHATFFLIGSHVRRYPELVRRIHDEGHLIGNHSHDHAWWGMFRMRRYWRDQIERCDDVIEGVTGERPSWFRPPMGFRNMSLMRACREADKHVATWSRRAFDGLPTTSRQIQDRLSGSGAGEILALHDGAPPGSNHQPVVTIDAVDALLDQWQRHGVQSVRLDALVNI